MVDSVNGANQHPPAMLPAGRVNAKIAEKIWQMLEAEMDDYSQECFVIYSQLDVHILINNKILTHAEMRDYLETAISRRDGNCQNELLSSLAYDAGFFRGLRRAVEVINSEYPNVDAVISIRKFISDSLSLAYENYKSQNSSFAERFLDIDSFREYIIYNKESIGEGSHINLSIIVGDSVQYDAGFLCGVMIAKALVNKTLARYYFPDNNHCQCLSP